MRYRSLPSLPGYLGLVLLLSALAGCVHRQPQPALSATDLAGGFYFHNHRRPQNRPDTLFFLCFSGGGSRAAALSYGVLEELRRIPLANQGMTNRLLDEVDAISSVSGGSVTAAAYALHGERVFDRLEPAFLRRNVQGALLARTLNPLRWPKIWSRTYGLSDLAAELYDELLFDGATFADLSQKDGAYVVINATDISTGARFSFTQYQFDLLCTDLAPLRVSQAVAASSAVPGLLSPITIDNHAGECESEIALAVNEAIAQGAAGLASRPRFHFREMQSYLDATNHPYVHLVDGGVSDNLGIRAVLDGIYAVQTHPSAQGRFDLARVERVAIVVVNAYSKPDTGWARREQPPGGLALAVAGATIPMDRYSYETIELLKEQIEQWRNQQRSNRGSDSASTREIRFYPVIVSFADLPDSAERSYFLNQPTSFRLSNEAVDRLREVGGRLLRKSTEFQGFLRDLHGMPVTAPTPHSPSP